VALSRNVDYYSFEGSGYIHSKVGFVGHIGGSHVPTVKAMEEEEVRCPALTGLPLSIAERCS
jgi:hypothetical protein